MENKEEMENREEPDCKVGTEITLSFPSQS